MSCTTLSNTDNNKKHIKHQHPDNIQLTKSIQKQQHPDDTHRLPNTQNHNRRRREKRLAPSISTKQPQRKTPNMMPQLPPVNAKNLLQCGGSGGRRPPSAVPAAARVHGQCRRWASGMKSCMGRGARVHIQPLVGGGLSVQLRVCGADVGDGGRRRRLNSPWRRVLLVWRLCLVETVGVHREVCPVVHWVFRRIDREKQKNGN